MGSEILIQMPLVGEAVDVWRPVSSRPLGGELFLVALQPIPEMEDWAFAPGEIVRCVPRRFADGDVHETAVARVPEEPATVQCWLEFHDSVLQRVESGPGNVRLQLDGYIHRQGAGAFLDAQIAEGNAWVATDNDVPVSLSAFNATLPHIVQLGGIYTPPELRGRGFAKAAVAASLLAARDRGASRAVLFTNGPSAIRTYESLGFQRVGDYALVLFE